MIYITVRQAPRYHQMTIEEFLFGPDRSSFQISQAQSCTRTYTAEHLSRTMRQKTDTVAMTQRLVRFCADTRDLRSAPRESLYATFYLPKRGKGWDAVFKAMWASQDHYIRCDKRDAAAAVRSGLEHLIERHETSAHSALAQEAFVQIAQKLGTLGFSMDGVDVESWLKKGFRRIDAPNDILKARLTELKNILQNDFGALWHSTAFAYIPDRSTIDAVRRHQANESKWFAGFDLSDFFGSTTLDFVLRMLVQIYPFAQIIGDSQTGYEVLRDALELGFLNGHLPQGTPLSPALTNIMMIPIDHTLANGFREFTTQKHDGSGEGTQRMIYTRYADDFLISSRYEFSVNEVADFIKSTLQFFGAPFTINDSKTSYGSSAGSNYHLGVLLNAENKITVGHETKHTFRAMLSNYVMDERSGVMWDKARVQQLAGLYSYYRMVERDSFNRIVSHLSDKFHVSIPDLLKRDLSIAP